MAKHAVSRAVCQGDAVCPAGCIDTCALAGELRQRLEPDTVRIGVYGCFNRCLRASMCREAFDLKIFGGQQGRCHTEVCIGCGRCVKRCPADALSLQNGRVSLEQERCVHCGGCVRVCPVCAFTADEGYLLTGQNHQNRFFLQKEELFATLEHELGRESNG